MEGLIIAIIKATHEDLSIDHNHSDIDNCITCKNKLSATIFIQSDLYMWFLAQLGIHWWLSPERVMKYG